MKLLDVRAYRGPNLYANVPVVMARVALDAGADAHGISAATLQRLLPGSASVPSERALLLVASRLMQQAGGAPSWSDVVAGAEPEERLVLLAYDDESSAALAVDLAADLIEDARAGVEVDVERAVARVAQAREENHPGPSTKSILDAAAARGIPTLKLDDSHYQLGHGAFQARIQATMTSRTSAIAVETADDKTRTKDILSSVGVRVPRGGRARAWEDAVEIAERLGYPVVVKPREGNHGRGVTVGVANEQELAAAFERAKEIDKDVVIEQVLVGADFRILVIGHEFIAAARRDPAQVVGDGRRSVRELIDAANEDPRRGRGHERSLTRIVVDEDTESLLAKQGLALEAVPDAGVTVRLKSTANISTGGTSADVTDEVHASVREMAERVSRAIDLDVCGIDVVAPHLNAPLEETGGGVCEVNAAPGFRMHLDPSTGRARDVAGPLVDMLFPRGATTRVPIVAVTGTNGKTTTTRLVAHILAHAGHRVGIACTDGVEVRGRRVLTGDYSGPAGAEAVLKDATVTRAVLEVARGGILRRGLGFDACDVGILLNVESDHLGSDGVDSLDTLARVKGTVVRAVRPGGVAVLNAQDPRSLAAATSCRGRVILFGMEPSAPPILDHVASGGEAVSVRDGVIVRIAPGGETPLLRVDEAPITLRGLADCNVRNALAASAAALGLGMGVGDIAAALRTFHATPAHVPGRLNLFEKSGVKILVDYGHNPPALRAIESTLAGLQPRRRIVSASATGNRRDEDLHEFGQWLARLYDEIHLSDPDPRGRPDGETARLVEEGIRSVGGRSATIMVHADEAHAIRAALRSAKPDDLVVLQAEDVPLAIAEATAWSPRAQHESSPLTASPAILSA